MHPVIMCYIDSAFATAFSAHSIYHIWIIDSAFQVVADTQNLVLDGYHKAIRLREELSLYQPRVRSSVDDVGLCQVMDVSSKEELIDSLFCSSSSAKLKGVKFLCAKQSFSCTIDVLLFSEKYLRSSLFYLLWRFCMSTLQFLIRGMVILMILDFALFC